MIAADVAKALACGKRACPCDATLRKGRGPTHCPAHDDRRPSLSVGNHDSKILVHCQSGCPQDTVITILKQRGLWPDAVRPRQNRQVARTTKYQIRDPNGHLAAVHERHDKANGGKTYTWRSPDGSVGLDGIPPSALPLYGSEKLADTPTGNVVLITEGEKAAEALNRRSVLALGTVTGAAGIPGPDALAVLLRFRVVLWPDNDDGGQSHTQRIALSLADLRHRDVRMLAWPDAPAKGDAADFKGDDVALAALLGDAQPYTPPSPPDLATLLEDVRSFVRRYVILSIAQADAVALWVLHTWTLDAADSTPYLSVASAEKRSGKTRTLEVLSLLVARPWFTGRTSAAALLRKVDKLVPTLLLDESDAAFKGEKEYAEGLRGLLNAGHRRGGVATLCINKGDDFKDFSVFCCKAIAGIGKLPDTVADRAIPINLKRRAPGEHVERFRRRDVEPVARELQQRLLAWADAHVEPLATARPEIPDKLDDRAADGWEPLLAIADTAGVDWPERGRKAALALSTGDGREDDSLGVRLLADIKAVFDKEGVDCIATANLVDVLVKQEEAPWGDLRGRELDARTLARLLRPYGIKPGTVRLGADTAKGYQGEWFADAWGRYTARVSPESPSQASQASQNADTDRADVMDVTDVTDIRPIPSLKPSDGHLARFAEEQLGLPIMERRPMQRGDSY